MRLLNSVLLALSTLSLPLSSLAQTNPVDPSYTGSVWYTTLTVTSLETYLPSATTFVNNGKTYTVTEATTITITDCSACSVSYPVVTSTISGLTLSPSSSASVPALTTAPYNNGTTTTPTIASTGSYSVSGSATGSAPVVSFTGAALRIDGSGSMVALVGAVLGVVGML
ncbi:MAG: hypothetical protein Q9227_006248 [Pyrenula ochraceoflavens]